MQDDYDRVMENVNSIIKKKFRMLNYKLNMMMYYVNQMNIKMSIKRLRLRKSNFKIYLIKKLKSIILSIEK